MAQNLTLVAHIVELARCTRGRLKGTSSKMQDDSASIKSLSLEANGLLIRILALAGSPGLWRASAATTQAIISYALKDKWLSTWKDDMVWGAASQDAYIHKTGIEVLIRHTFRLCTWVMPLKMRRNLPLTEVNLHSRRIVQPSTQKYAQWMWTIGEQRRSDGRLKLTCPSHLLIDQPFYGRANTTMNLQGQWNMTTKRRVTSDHIGEIARVFTAVAFLNGRCHSGHRLRSDV